MQVLTDVRALRRKAAEIRKLTIEAVYRAKSGHIGGGIGVADLLAPLYYKYMRHHPQNPRWPDRDRFILSNGHICPVLYAILADCGYFPLEDLWTLRKLGSHLQGHPSVHPREGKGTPGIELSGGSLGNGHSYALGHALAARVLKKDYRVFCMVSDGDCQEGQTWEAAEAAAHYQVDNLITLVDFNKSQIDGPTDEIMSMGDLAAKFRAFGWHAIEIDGHDYDQILSAFDEALAARGKPKAIVAHTVIGKGVSYMEGDYKWHHGAPSDEQFRLAVTELDAVIAANT